MEKPSNWDHLKLVDWVKNNVKNYENVVNILEENEIDGDVLLTCNL